MLDAVRSRVAESIDFERSGSLDDLTEWPLYADVTGFGVLAWVHFNQPGNGFKTIEALLDGSLNMRSENAFFPLMGGPSSLFEISC